MRPRHACFEIMMSSVSSRRLSCIRLCWGKRSNPSIWCRWKFSRRNDRKIMNDVKHLAMPELEAGLDEIRKAPRDSGLLKLIVRRPAVDERQVLEQGELDLAEGLVGDTWNMRGSSRTADGSSHPDMQLNIMNAR